MRLMTSGPVLLFTMVWAVPTAISAQPSALPVISRVEPVAFPAYEEYRGINRYAPTPLDYKAARDDARFVMERLTYSSDGLSVHAYLYRPARQPVASPKMPVVIFNRGSYVRTDFAPEVLMPARRLAQQGYLVIAPMYRGSGGAPGHDEMGGRDVHDIFALVPVLKELGFADLDRIFLYGESRGAIMSMIAARDGFPARAVAIYGAITDMSTFIAEGGAYRSLGTQVWPGFPANEAEIAESRSAVRWAEKLNAPVLIMHGGDDHDVSPVQALNLAVAFQKLDRPYELKIFHGERHTISGRSAERDDDAMRWFRRFDAASRLH